jgi:hypothetical protein
MWRIGGIRAKVMKKYFIQYYDREPVYELTVWDPDVKLDVKHIGWGPSLRAHQT